MDIHDHCTKASTAAMSAANDCLETLLKQFEIAQHARTREMVQVPLVSVGVAMAISGEVFAELDARNKELVALSDEALADVRASAVRFRRLIEPRSDQPLGNMYTRVLEQSIGREWASVTSAKHVMDGAKTLLELNSACCAAVFSSLDACVRRGERYYDDQAVNDLSDYVKGLIDIPILTDLYEAWQAVRRILERRTTMIGDVDQIASHFAELAEATTRWCLAAEITLGAMRGETFTLATAGERLLRRQQSFKR